MTLEMTELLLKMYKDERDKVQILYKYKKYDNARIESDFVVRGHWVSELKYLNDPFDINLVYPEKITKEEARKILNLTNDYYLQRVRNISTHEEIASFVSGIRKFEPLEELFLLTLQLGDPGLVEHLLSKNRTKDWVKKLFKLVLKMHKNRLKSVAIFCLTERRENRLMWSHYTNNFEGYCIGYVVDTTSNNPRTIHKVKYKEKSYKINPQEFIMHPGECFIDSVTTKSKDWSYEEEWRFVMGPDSHLCSSFFPIKEVIFGYKMKHEDRENIMRFLSDLDVDYYQAQPDVNSNNFEIKITKI